MTTLTTDLRFEVTPSAGEVSGILVRPDPARWLYVFGHGAGAGMRHRFMEDVSADLAERGIATFRYQFPYTERRSRRIDPQPILLATVRAAVAMGHKATGDLPILAGGKSMGGRMTSLAFAEAPIEGVRGLVFFGFPLHLAGQPATARADHLERVSAPMLFLQGTRDSLASLALLEPIVRQLGERATLHVVDGADHSFALPTKAGKVPADTRQELADAVAQWADRLNVVSR